MAKLRTAMLLLLACIVFLAIRVQNCPAQERRTIAGGEKFVWDPVIKQWVLHQGTQTIKANRGSNALPSNSSYGDRQRPAESSVASTNSSSARRSIVGGEKWVWDPVIRQWVFHQGTKTIQANRGSNALPSSSFYGGGPQSGDNNSTTAKSSSSQRKIVGGKIYVWDLHRKRWVQHLGTTTTKARRETHAPPNSRTSPKPLGQPHSLATPTATERKSDKSPPATRVITNPYFK